MKYLAALALFVPLSAFAQAPAPAADPPSAALIAAQNAVVQLTGQKLGCDTNVITLQQENAELKKELAAAKPATPPAPAKP